MVINSGPADPAVCARWRGFTRPDGRLTAAGAAAAADAHRQQRLWQAYRQQHPDAVLSFNPLGGFRIEDVLSADIVAALESGDSV